MELSALAGNRRLKEQLTGQEDGRGLAHAYILSGPAGSGRHTLARLLAAAMVCTAAPEKKPCGQCGPCRKVRDNIHPDVKLISGPGDGKPISVDQVRALRTDAYIRPNERERKVYLLERAEQMNPSAQNAMLKLLEEGPSYAAFLLLAENSAALLQTVRSRCEELVLTPVSPLEGEEWLASRCEELALHPVSVLQAEEWLARTFPDADPKQRRQAALDCQGILGRAVERLEGAEEAADRRRLAGELACVLESGRESEVLERTMELEKLGREELSQVLDALETALADRLAGGGDRRRLLRAVGLVRKLRGAAKLNAAPGQLAGWLCAGMFETGGEQ